MPEKNEPEKIWDEYDWERFLQQQDLKTERYMELLEKYGDDPDRDQIIAREMGWPHPEDSEDFDWSELSFEASSDAHAFEQEEPEEEEMEGIPESFELHPLYQASFALTVWIDQIFEGHEEFQNHPAAVKLATNSAIASAKLAAALSDDDAEEIGMTIAYLKRALKAISNAIDANLVFVEEAKLSSHRRRQLHTRLFQVRDGIIELMGDYRNEWRKRLGR
ncbi:MAG: hypothetical protein NTZ46_08415 [Verrucomicrobia bacterium]|nr:hypothetical protein [Verrucomicrobiota bacterium]